MTNEPSSNTGVKVGVFLNISAIVIALIALLNQFASNKDNYYETRIRGLNEEFERTQSAANKSEAVIKELQAVIKVLQDRCEENVKKIDVQTKVLLRHLDPDGAGK